MSFFTCAATRVNLLKCREIHQTQNPSICSYFASSRNVWQTIAPPLHGGAQGFVSPRLHSQRLEFCRLDNGEGEGQLPRNTSSWKKTLVWRRALDRALGTAPRAGMILQRDIQPGDPVHDSS
jgi:hypothetical protein